MINEIILASRSGERKKVALSVPFNENNFEETVQYDEAYVSPNKQFVAFAARGFEEKFVQIYDVSSDILHDRIYGEVVEWRDNNLLEINACNLSGEQCSVKLSVSAERPWEVTTISQ